MTTPICGPIAGTPERAIVWAASKGATSFFLRVIPLYWQLAATHGGVDPEVAVCQAAHETGYGHFGRAVTPEHNNFCGLKIAKPVGPDSNPDDHARFPTPSHGVAAHLDHLSLYAAAPGFPREMTYDTRHFKWIAGKSSTVEGLSGSWAPSAAYAQSILSKLTELRSFTG